MPDVIVRRGNQRGRVSVRWVQWMGQVGNAPSWKCCMPCLYCIVIQSMSLQRQTNSGFVPDGIPLKQSCLYACSLGLEQVSVVASSLRSDMPEKHCSVGVDRVEAFAGGKIPESCAALP